VLVGRRERLVGGRFSATRKRSPWRAPPRS
jgi:hypothetical protein